MAGPSSDSPPTRRHAPVGVDLSPSPRATALATELDRFVDELVVPAETAYDQQVHASGDPHHVPTIHGTLTAKAQRRGLWNLFLPPGIAESEGLSNLDYAPLAEIMGRSPIAAEACNCSAPDSGNMEILARHGTEEQRRRWLSPLLRGEIRSAFAMTEPAVASSDATSIECRIARDGDDYVVDGHKWWVSGGADPRCAVLLVMGKTDPGAERHRQRSIVLVPMDAAGIDVQRSLPIFGFHDREGHCEITFRSVRVPSGNLLGEEGAGFAVAQGRLAPGRLHHCMRCIGAAERALDLLCRRVTGRRAFGGRLSDQGVIRDWIAASRIEIDQARLLALRAAWAMDTLDGRDAAVHVSAAKAVVPAMAATVIDRAVQAHGAMGLSADAPLARMYASVRALRIADGPDEAHRAQVARRELARWS